MLDDQTTGRRETPNSTTCDFLAACIVMLGVAAALGALGQSPPSAWWTQSTSRRARPLATFPPVVLWAWERPEALDFIDVQESASPFSPARSTSVARMSSSALDSSRSARRSTRSSWR